MEASFQATKCRERSLSGGSFRVNVDSLFGDILNRSKCISGDNNCKPEVGNQGGSGQA